MLKSFWFYDQMLIFNLLNNKAEKEGLKENMF